MFSQGITFDEYFIQALKVSTEQAVLLLLSSLLVTKVIVPCGFFLTFAFDMSLLFLVALVVADLHMS